MSSTATIPAIHILHALRLLGRWNVDAQSVLEGLGTTEELLAQPGARIALEQLARVVEILAPNIGPAELGIYLGWQMKVSAHGFLGFAALSSPTLHEALKVAVRFAPTLTNAISLVLREGPETTSLVIEERVDLGVTQELIVSALLIGIWQIGNALTGRNLEGEGAVTFPEPPAFERFRYLITMPLRFDSSAHRLTFATEMLKLPLLMADPAAQQLAREQLERELDSIKPPETFKERVANLLALDGGGFRSMPEVAKLLYMSDRTMKRRLLAEGTSFGELLDDARKARALVLLRSPKLTLHDVAEQVGYSDLSNFTRAFRRWTGVTPSKFRAR
ncbi:MAG TPA: AraC family transcriptional regulator ligand-binding domain-containing protein [Polyangiales bacterium]|nr:AraC family transcriptional regulator ligand-binding domain-containing protein [Polyangiales bacterium]